MRFSKWISGLALLAIGAVMAGGNLWVAASRSTIMQPLQGTITGKQVRAEKIGGVDDVYFLRIDRETRIQVDRSVFDAVERGEAVEKEPWSRTLRHGKSTVELGWSVDVRGMVWLMPLVMLVFVALAYRAARPMPLR